MSGFLVLQQVLDGVDVRVGQPKVQLWSWVVAKLVSLATGTTCLG